MIEIDTNADFTERAIKTDLKSLTPLVPFKSIEVELNKLQTLFPPTSAVLTHSDRQNLIHLCQMHADLQLRLLKQWHKLKGSHVLTKISIRDRQMKLTSEVEAETLSSKILNQKFTCKLFKNSTPHS